MNNFLHWCAWILIRVLSAFLIAFGLSMAADNGLGWSVLGAAIAMVGVRVIEVNWQAYQDWQRYGFYWHCDRCLRSRRQLYAIRAVDEKTRDEFRDNHNRLVHLEER